MPGASYFLKLADDIALPIGNALRRGYTDLPRRTTQRCLHVIGSDWCPVDLATSRIRRLDSSASLIDSRARWRVTPSLSYWGLPFFPPRASSVSGSQCEIGEH